MKIVSAISASSRGRHAILIGVCTICMCVYWIITHNEVDIFQELNVLSNQKTNDIALYLTRLTSITVLFFIVPLVVAKRVGYSIAQLGFRKPLLDKSAYHTIWLTALVIIIASFTASRNFSMQQFYPFSKQIAAYIAEHRAYVVLHILTYGIFYYIPWEFFFRGVLMLAFVDKDDKWYGVSCCMQVIPSTLLHFGHPVAELFAAIPFGFFAAYLTWKTKSIIPVVVLHTIAGIALDIFLMF